jgi:hypothetical protein
MELRGILFLICFASVRVLEANSLPLATVNMQVSGLAQRPCINCTESYSQDSPGALSLFTFSGDVEAFLSPKVFEFADVRSTLFQSVAARATETYSFEFVGPAAQLTLDVAVKLGVDHAPGFASPAAGAEAQYAVLANGLQIMFAGAQCDITFCTNKSFDGVLTHTIFANQIYTVQAVVGVEAVAGDESVAEVDPMIYLDPSVPNAGAYTLLLSDGVGNLGPDSSPVPEPASAGLSIAGLASLVMLRKGWMQRRS